MTLSGAAFLLMLPMAMAGEPEALDFRTGIECFQALGKERFLNRYADGFVAVPGFLEREPGAFLLTEKGVEFSPKQLMDRYGFFPDFALGGRYDAVPSLKAQKAPDPKLHAQGMYYFSRTLQVQMDLLARKYNPEESASEFKKPPLKLTPEEEDQTNILFVSLLFMLLDPSEAHQPARSGLELKFHAVYLNFKAARARHRPFIPSPEEFRTIQAFADYPGWGQIIYAEVRGFLKDVRDEYNAEYDRKLFVQNRELYLQALRTCARVRGGGVAEHARRLLESEGRPEKSGAPSGRH